VYHTGAAAAKRPEYRLRMRFFKKIQDWILKSERVRKRIFSFFINQINPRSLGSWWVKGTEESISRVDSPVPLMHHDPRDLGMICLILKERQDPFSDSLGLKNPILDFLKETHPQTAYCGPV